MGFGALNVAPGYGVPALLATFTPVYMQINVKINVAVKASGPPQGVAQCKKFCFHENLHGS